MEIHVVHFIAVVDNIRQTTKTNCVGKKYSYFVVEYNVKHKLWLQKNIHLRAGTGSFLI